MIFQYTLRFKGFRPEWDGVGVSQPCPIHIGESYELPEGDRWLVEDIVHMAGDIPILILAEHRL